MADALISYRHYEDMGKTGVGKICHDHHTAGLMHANCVSGICTPNADAYWLCSSLSSNPCASGFHYRTFRICAYHLG